jgi:hypothetical protein
VAPKSNVNVPHEKLLVYPRPIPLRRLFACSSGSNISEQIESQFKASEATSVNLAVVGPASWDRVCVLRPYTDNQRTAQVLGFKWDSEAKTSIAESDGINVLVFVQGKEVVAHTEHPRSKGDF